LQTGSPRDCYLDPVSIAAARLLGPANLVPAEVRGGVARSPFGDLPVAAPDGPATLMIRPEGRGGAGEGAPVGGTGGHFGGAFHEVTVAAGGVTAALRQVGAGAPAVGPAHVVIDPSRARLLAG